MVPLNVVPVNLFLGMSDYQSQATLGRTHQIFRFFKPPQPDIVSKTRRTGLPASHAGITDVSSTRSSFCNGVDGTDYREPPQPPSNFLLRPRS